MTNNSYSKKEKIQYIKDHYFDKGMTIKKLAQIFNCSTDNVSHIISELDLPNKSTFENKKKEEYIKLHYYDMTNKDIAEKLNCSDDWVTKVAKRLNLTNKKEVNKKNNVYSESQENINKKFSLKEKIEYIKNNRNKSYKELASDLKLLSVEYK